MLQQNLSELCELDPITQRLTELYCRKELCCRRLETWFSKVDIEALPSETTCMAAVAGARCHFESVPSTEIPRLRGIIKYVHTLNSGMMAGVCMIGNALNRAGIDVLLLEDAALYVTFPDAPQHHLWQIRIGVRRRDFEKAVDLIRSAGFEVEKFVYAALANQGVTRQVFIISCDDDSHLWQNTVQVKKGTVAFLCPTLGATFIEISKNEFRALTKPNPRAVTVRWCMDMKSLVERMTAEDWQQAAKIAENEHANGHVRLLMEVFSALSDDETVKNKKELFHWSSNIEKISKLLLRHRNLPKTGHRLQKAFLRCRLRRPDSVIKSYNLFLQQIIKKLAR